MYYYEAKSNPQDDLIEQKLQTLADKHRGWGFYKQPLNPNMHWSMDFMSDSLVVGWPFRSFNVIDDFNREALNITIDTRLP